MLTPYMEEIQFLPSFDVFMITPCTFSLFLSSFSPSKAKSDFNDDRGRFKIFREIGRKKEREREKESKKERDIYKEGEKKKKRKLDIKRERWRNV